MFAGVDGFVLIIGARKQATGFGILGVVVDVWSAARLWGQMLVGLSLSFVVSSSFFSQMAPDIFAYGSGVLGLFARCWCHDIVDAIVIMSWLTVWC